MAGRPTDYTDELALEICHRIASGESLRAICRDDHMPDARTVHYWLLDESKTAFFQQYAKARDVQAEVISEEAMEIADAEGDVNRDRLRVDTRKWYLSKVKPKKFGDKMDFTTNGKDLPAPIARLDVSGDNSVSKDSAA